AGAGINQVVDVSRAPKGSLYHYFPGGKQQLVSEALREADAAISASFETVFAAAVPIGQRVRTLFAKTADAIEASAFTKSCPVAAVTLDLDEETAPVREVCQAIFERWVDVITQGLQDLPPRERRPVAQLILASLEGALILARASGSRSALTDVGTALALTLDARLPGRRRGRARHSR